MTGSSPTTRESGFGLVELLIAMTVLTLGIMGIVAGFSAGILSLQRASTASTAATLADTQMEAYRAQAFATITPTCASTADASSSCSTSTTVSGADGKSYRVDVAIGWACAVGTLGGTVATPTCTGTPTARPAKLVVIVVRDGADTSKVLARESSTFDAATG